MYIKLVLLSLLLIPGMKTVAQNIHRTACAGNLARLDSLLQNEDLHVLDDRGRTLLHWAVGCNKKEIFNDLIRRGIDINTADKDGHTALYVAIQFQSDTLFDQLIELQEDDNWKRQQGAKLMERAILDQNLTYLQKLVESDISLEQINERGSTPLEIAKKSEAQEISEWLIAKGADEAKVRTFKMKGEYMGLTPPGPKREVFAPNFISTEEYEYGSIFSADGKEFYYSIARSNAVIRHTALINGEWSQPKTILADDKYGYNDPFLFPDENRLYFISQRTLDGTDAKEDHDIWYVEREGDEWSEPINAGPNINSENNEYYISFTDSGTMYFASNVNAPEERKRSDQDIYYATFVDGEFQEPVRLSDAINTENYEADVFVAPDESYLIFCSTRPEGLGRGDLYISFKKENKTWTKAVNMGELVNTEYHELCPFVTADGKYLLYTSNQDIYWISTAVFEQLR